MPINANEALMLTRLQDFLQREKARQDRSFNRLAMLHDDFKPQVERRLKQMVSSETFEKLQPHIDISLNIFQDVMEQISQIYLDEPIRLFQVGDDDEESQETKDLKALYDEMDFDSVMARVNLYMNALNEVIVMPVFRSGKWCADILTPNSISVVTDPEDPQKPAKVLIKRMIDEARDEYYYTVWEPGAHYQLTKENVEIPIGTNEGMVNPFGIIPMVFIHRRQSDGGFWDECSGDALVECCIMAACKVTLLNYSNTWNNFKQMALKTNEPEKVSKDMVISPDVAVMVPEEGDAIVLDYQLAMENIDNHIDRYVNRIAARYGISRSDIDAVIEESGKHLQIKNAKLERIRKEGIKVLRKAEREFLDVLKVVAKVEQKKTFTAEVVLDYAQMTQATDDKDALEVLEKEVSMNVKSLVDAFIERNPDYARRPRSEARKKVEEIIKENNELKESIDEAISARLNETTAEGGDDTGDPISG